MQKRSRTKPGDLNQLAARIVADATGESSQQEPAEAKSEKDPAAVALGRRGGLKGGPARRDALSAEQRKESAAKAARARWGLPKENE